MASPSTTSHPSSTPSPPVSSPSPSPYTTADSLTPPSCRQPPIHDHSSTMKDVTSYASTRLSRNSFYSKKRPSPHGIAKSRRHTPISVAVSASNPSTSASAQHTLALRV